MRAIAILAFCIGSSYASGYISNFQCIYSGQHFPHGSAIDAASKEEEISSNYCTGPYTGHGCCIDFNDKRDGNDDQDSPKYYPCEGNHGCIHPNAGCVPQGTFANCDCAGKGGKYGC
ncbi:unnamed protein product [Zymoseptoria tritici ST99CH_1A5]|uniref:Uncharacterized protein n=1 Tax=Zymoseptoria tritici ST99CH_1A5 TaxID=1276529 RepID=A0A1Y6LL53_ZYMTR|nr:unnamed protein product [Zymoseptoria tritici ST99CH_1A5]